MTMLKLFGGFTKEMLDFRRDVGEMVGDGHLLSARPIG